MLQVNQQKRVRKVAEKITDKRVVGRSTYYYVLWKQASPSQGTWLPCARLAKVHRLVRQYQSSLKTRRRRQLQRTIQILTNAQQSSNHPKQPVQQQLLKQQDPADQCVLVPASIFPEHCVDLISDSEPQKQQNDKMQEELVKVSRFDCIKGIWVNKQYSPSELQQINQLRDRLAWRHEKESVCIRNIIKVNGQLIVQYQRNGKKFQCLLQSFKSYMPQLLIRFLLSQYDPAYHEVRPHLAVKYEQQSFSDSE